MKLFPTDGKIRLQPYNHVVVLPFRRNVPHSHVSAVTSHTDVFLRVRGRHAAATAFSE